MTFTDFTLTAGVVSEPPPPQAASKAAAANAVTAQEALFLVVFEIKVFSVRLKIARSCVLLGPIVNLHRPGPAQGNYR
ncbi:hypothetical protein AVHY2522_18910 [Acidovorax sp. SUPP2522]|uniref:hypothetical protein n=1 Tax=unclassified Acidovorax TaxID=2684926 RepID=UPI00234B4882|nr:MULTISPECIES: hypothetical protein [unclassified Acidovorax]WCM98186.1 hypothetical protein M5C96_01535 [Acidovorax sp. GBBC 1281]GKS96537.1 hypothetical protein AVAK2825_18400 [Acidovorax sp. SUPP2825]GKT18465.1 hypothetical protein AVHY2522_18910 [Acidovorax sp. SUPP2522]